MRRLPRTIVGLLAMAIVVGPAAVASAHPLGNFTVNASSSLVVRVDEVAIAYVVDMAEIPAFRERRAMDADADGAVSPVEGDAYASAACDAYADGLHLTVGGRPAPANDRGGSSLTFPPGEGGLTTLRLRCDLVAPLRLPLPDGDGAVDVVFADGNHPQAIGWREVSAVGDGVTLVDSDVPTSSATDALRTYPRDDLPLDVRTAALEVRAGGPALAATEEAPGSAGAPAAGGGVLASLVGRSDLTPALVGLMILAALAVGAVHALGPGHGKTLIGAYLVGGTGTIRHAVGVGAAVSLMHTASVLALGGVVLAAERVFAPERVYPWLGLVAGSIAIVLGGMLLRARLGALDGPHGHGHSHGSAEPHGLLHEGDRDAKVEVALSGRALIALAFSGGALPSPAALVVFLGAVSIGRAALGLALILAFSTGLAVALIGVGVVAIRARDVAGRRLSVRVTRLVPVGSAVAILAMGMFLAVRAATQL